MKIKYIDLFCGIGGFRVAAETVCKKHGIESECVFSSDIDPDCQVNYSANFGDVPFGDITLVDEAEVPDHDFLFAGFPCQPFSIIGKSKGFEESRGTLFFDIARILDKKKPGAFVLENVKRLVSHDKGRTFEVILKSLREMGYDVRYKILNALDYGLPQKRERVFIVGFDRPVDFTWPEPVDTYTPLSQILEANPDKKLFASEYIVEKRKAAHQSKFSPAIWHENKSGNISSYPYSCALRAGSSYNYLLVDGVRRLSPREMLRLQGFPDSYKIVCGDSQTRKQAGNSVPVNAVQAVFDAALTAYVNSSS